MPQEIISKKTRYEFREHFSGSYVLREIEAEFDSADIPLDFDHEPGFIGARRSLVERYYHSLDLTNYSHARKLLNVFENVLSALESRVSADPDPERNPYPRKAFDNLRKWLIKDGFDYKGGRLVPRGSLPQLPQLKAAVIRADAAYLHQQIDRMDAAVGTDPWLAIGTAKELVETTCRTVLKERGVEADKNWEVPRLVKETAKRLRLSPDDIPNEALAAETVRRILSNLAAVAHGLAELRNPFGTGHGQHAGARGLKSRHARLAVGAAATLALFLYDTHAER